MKRIITIIIITLIGCSEGDKKNMEASTAYGDNRSELDSHPGIQDVLLGEDTVKYSDRIDYRDGMTTSKEAALTAIKIDSIQNNCFGACNRLLAYSFKGKIMLITMKAFWCPEVLSSFKNKFGNPDADVGNNMSWETEKFKLIITEDDEDWGWGRESYKLEFIDKNLVNEYQKSIKAKI